LAIAINAVGALVYLSVAGMDGGFKTQIDRGAAYAADGSYDKALKCFMRAISIAPNSPVGYAYAADANVRLGNAATAIALMEGFVETSPRSVDSFEYLLELYKTYNVPLEKQIEVLTRAAALFTDSTFANRAGELTQLLLHVGPPLTEPAPGVYPTPQQLQVTNLSDGDTVYYTLNGDVPTTSSTRYDPQRGIRLSSGRSELSLIRLNADGSKSDIVTYLYSIGVTESADALLAYTSVNGANIATGGIAVFGGNDTFFSHISHGGVLFSERSGQLADDRASYINLSDGWIYYVNASDGNRIYRIKTDGNGRTKLTDDASGMLHFAGGRLFYQNRSEGGALFSAASDGSNRRRITPDLVSGFFVWQGVIYYRNDSRGGALYSSSLDGIDQVELIKGAVTGISVYDNYLYFINSGDDGRVHRVPIEGGTPSAVTSEAVAEFIVSEGFIYYRGETQTGIYRIPVSGGSATLLTGNDGAKLSLCGSKLYFVNYSDASLLYTMSTSGGGLAPVA